MKIWSKIKSTASVAKEEELVYFSGAVAYSTSAINHDKFCSFAVRAPMQWCNGAIVLVQEWASKGEEDWGVNF